MPIKTFRRVVFGIALEHALKDDPFGAVGDMLGSRQHLYTVISERFLMDRHFVFIAGKSVKFVNTIIVAKTAAADAMPTRKEEAKTVYQAARHALELITAANPDVKIMLMTLPLWLARNDFNTANA